MGSVIDTSKMNAGERAALETAEAAREEVAAGGGGFAASLFLGSPRFSQVAPYPTQHAADKEEGDAFLRRLEQFLETTDPDAIDREGEIPDDVLSGLAELKAFAIKVPQEYGGLGLSQTNYARAAELLGGWCGNLTALLSAHQSIGVPQPVLTFGTEAQKKKYLPRFGEGEISAFALTEPGVGSDPAGMKTMAEPDPDGEHFIINGEKLWCTNGVKAGVIVVMACTPAPEGSKSGRRPITAFIVEMDAPGVEVTHRCHFMGLRALYNGVVRFTDVKVHRDAILHEEGKGLRVALTTLNTGRLTLPAACLGMGKACLKEVRRWTGEREQWGRRIGGHAAIADKVARIAARVYALEAMTSYVCALVDRDKKADIRIEAAMAKMWGTEVAWEIVDETMQIRGGRGYETADSLKARGEPGFAVERFFRDSRINTIFEGSSEIMRLFIAREALDPHLKIGAAVVNSQLPMAQRAMAGAKAAAHYAWWYPSRWLPLPREGSVGATFGSVDRFICRSSRRLSRSLFHGMARYGPKLADQQLMLGRIVDIATELFVLGCAASRAAAQIGSGIESREREELQRIVGFLEADAKRRVSRLFSELSAPGDGVGYRLTKDLLDHPEGYDFLR
ncbi:acyl-CoA dehydrogenase family protein [Sulfuriroseicoccus oceanibius]|uniref:Acyl-CoA dehydrogenase family protein n=1 Tax=Sulfuriroseicoccus oceanibius TaxID=2707525 RepID=A0A6B3L8Y6_9BACT|nr:acyl-CoA dehydrogenase family protein [Sulfuriroseicoccus oceanibius]QQL44151.1 acyl-CoA dehydrogenase family protein [Sulfuriroseicoccus oceanibius]